MFKIASEPTFTHDVTARVPVDGGFEEQKFKATFRVISPEDANAFDLATEDGQDGFLHRIIVRLHDIGDAEGKAMEWNDGVLTAVLKLPWARSALSRTYFAAVLGARTGN